VLLSPERALRLNQTAVEVLQRCTGKLSISQIIDALHDATGSGAVCADELTEDVLRLLDELRERQLVSFESSP
jgi:coenzyme PQQ biosynthesis protein PqqD